MSQLQTDIVVVAAGPAGLASSIPLGSTYFKGLLLA